MTDLQDMIGEATAGAPLGRKLGLQCDSLGPDRAVLSLPFDPSNVTIGEMVHGGAIATLADAAATAAAWSSDSLPDNPRGSTIGFAITYMNAALGADLVAEATVLKRGGSVLTVDVVVSDQTGKPIAKALVSYKLSGKS